MDAIVTAGLTKRYGGTIALDALSLTVPTGSVFGFLGPNGAGKSTTIRILLGLLRATDGDAWILGQPAWRRGARARAQVGYLPGDARFCEDRSARSELEYFDAVRGGTHRPEYERLARAFELDLDRRIRNYSRGMKQKLGLIQALMHRPALAILDEPTTALDPLVRETLNDELRRAAGQGRTVLFSSHTLSEVEALCDRVAILRAGRLIENDRVEVLRRRALRHVEIHFDGAPPGPAELPPALRGAQLRNGGLSGQWSGEVGELIGWLAGRRVRDVSISPPDLEDLFMAYYDGPRSATP